MADSPKKREKGGKKEKKENKRTIFREHTRNVTIFTVVIIRDLFVQRNNVYFFKVSTNVKPPFLPTVVLTRTDLKLGICDYKLHLAHPSPTTIALIYSQLRFSYNVGNNEITILFNCDFYEEAEDENRRKKEKKKKR